MRYLILLGFIFCLQQTRATVGGNFELKPLGYDSTGVYFLHYYYDESDRSPALWKYEFSSNEFSFDYNWSQYPNEEIEDGIKRMGWSSLSVLKDISISDSAIKITVLDTIHKTDPYTDEQYDLYPMQIAFNAEVFKIKQCYDGYDPELIHSYLLNNTYFLHYRYKGLCYETGYNKDTVFVVRERKNITPKGTDSSRIESVSMPVNQDTIKHNTSEENETYWEKGSPNYIYIFLPIILIALPIIILKWKKKDPNSNG